MLNETFTKIRNNLGNFVEIDQKQKVKVFKKVVIKVHDLPKKNVYVYKIKLNKTVAQLKNRIEKRGHCIEFKNQVLYFKAIKLPDDESLATCGLQDGSEVCIYVDNSIEAGEIV